MSSTPMMEQYNSFKKQYPDKIVLFRMGDFFETFGDDAKLTSKILNITLTTRDRHTDPTPLAGFPHHALNQYLPKIIKAGYCAVIVDQIEDPKFAKGIVKRAVTRVVTPSTIDSDNEEKYKNTYLGAFVKIKKDIFISFIDISTGDFEYTKFTYSPSTLSSLLSAYDPAEALLIEGEKELKFSDIPVQPLDKRYLNEQFDSEIVKDFFKVKSIESLGFEKNDSSIIPVAMSIQYILETQKISPQHIKHPKRFNITQNMVLDRATINNLELVRNSYSGEYKNSLLWIIDQTKTLMGRRLLYSWILNPLTNIEDIKKRLSVVEYFFNNPNTLEEVREILNNINDIERLAGKIGMNRLNARDLKALQYSLEKVKEVGIKIELLKDEFPNILSSQNSKRISEIIKIVDESIEENPPFLITEGHIIKKGYNKEVDEIRSITGDSKSWIKEFEEKEKKRTGISSLKIGFTKVFGYYIEITHTHSQKVPLDYIRKQTLVNAERYITEELKEKESLILNAEEKLGQLEYLIFGKIRNECLPYLLTIQEISKELGKLDVLAGFAYLGKQRNYVCPKIYDFGQKDGVINIQKGRHPIVEAISTEEFVSNDTNLNSKDARVAILTGPNMSGKSTYIRQVATIVLLAQIGCFVPADKCEISVVDRIFTRVGASDDLSRGRSTFMVEMDEAANILNNATKYSLVILDEIGRGTSTYDGVSIAWALAEYLAKEVKSRTLFATHYHELLKLSEKIGEGIKNFNVLVEEDQEKGVVIFLRKIVEGGTDRSYGIYVAQMAGLPQRVIKRANEILEGFEQESMFNGKNELRDTNIPLPAENGKKKREIPEIAQIPLFELGDDEITKEIKEVDLDNLTPIESLNLISSWKKKLNP